MFFGEEDARQMLRRLGNRAKLVDPADDFIAEGSVLWPGGCLLDSLMLFQ